MRLPLELFDLMFGLMADDPTSFDIETLKAFNLTSSTISSICERHLYSCLYLHCKPLDPMDHEIYRQPDPYYPQCNMSLNKYFRTQARRPGISRHVKRLGIVITDPFFHSHPRRGWWWCAVGLILRELDLQKIQWFKFYSSAALKIDSRIQHSTSEIMRSPALETLHLYHVRMAPLDHLFMGTPSRLRELDVSYSYMPPTIALPTSMTSNARLESLVLRTGSYQCIPLTRLRALHTPDGKPCLDLSFLSLLSVYISRAYRDKDIKLTHSLLSEATNITHLCLHVPKSQHPFTRLSTAKNPLDISEAETGLAAAIQRHSKALQTLVLIWEPSLADLFTRIAEFLQFSGTSTFTSLAQLQLQLFLPSGFDYLDCTWGEIDWAEMAYVVCESARFPALRRVGLSIASEDPTVHTERATKYFRDGKMIFTRWLESNGISLQFTLGVNYNLN